MGLPLLQERTQGCVAIDCSRGRRTNYRPAVERAVLAVSLCGRTRRPGIQSSASLRTVRQNPPSRFDPLTV